MMLAHTLSEVAACVMGVFALTQRMFMFVRQSTTWGSTWVVWHLILVKLGGFLDMKRTKVSI